MSSPVYTESWPDIPTKNHRTYIIKYLPRLTHFFHWTSNSSPPLPSSDTSSLSFSGWAWCPLPPQQRRRRRARAAPVWRSARCREHRRLGRIAGESSSKRGDVPKKTEMQHGIWPARSVVISPRCGIYPIDFKHISHWFQAFPSPEGWLARGMILSHFQVSELSEFSQIPCWNPLWIGMGVPILIIAHDWPSLSDVMVYHPTSSN